MRIMAWNCRGGRSTSTIRQHLLLHLKSSSPQLLFLSETKCNDQHLNRLLPSLPFSCHHSVPASGLSGGLCLLWNNSTITSIIASSPNFIIAQCSQPISWILVCVYGAPARKNRKQIWAEILSLTMNFNDPWMCIGDFNAILNPNEKQGGTTPTPSDLKDFTEFVSDAALMDLGYDGPAFTWSNRRQAHLNVKERLDRALCSTDWRIAFPSAAVLHLPATGSDHCPILISLFSKRKRKKKAFRMEARWIKHPDFNKIISKVWSSQASLPHKASKIRSHVLKWKSKVFDSHQKKIVQIQNEVAMIQCQPPTDDNIAKEKDLHTELEHLLNDEELHWRQRSRINWATVGDRNTSFYHLYAKNREKINKISAIIRHDGATTFDEDEIKFVLVDYFRNLYLSSGVDGLHLLNFWTTQTLSSNQHAAISAIPDPLTIRNTLASMSPLKTPGPDGLPAFFFQKTWELTGADLINTVQKFFTTHRLPNGLNHTHIALIPKKTNCISPSDFRPISLTNVAYKVITKLLANRIKPHLKTCISPFQGAFIEGRSITNNILLAREVFHYLKSTKARPGFFALKLDMSKAFDRVEWPALDHILSLMGFDFACRSLIRACIVAPSFSVIINGSPEGNFKSQRGLRQGCPLSPFLFITIMEALSRMLDQNLQLGLIKGLKVSPNGLPLTHLMFADDVLLFGACNELECSVIKATLASFGELSGQVINFDKSSILFSQATPIPIRNKILSIFKVRQKNLDDKYLGSRILSKRGQNKDMEDIISKTRSTLAGWKNKVLSQSGRTILIQSTLSSLPVYHMATTKLPKKICNQLDRLYRCFWWNHDPSQRKAHFISWRKIQRPKDLGGLGVRSTYEANQALLCKLTWQFVNDKNSVWTKVLADKYLNGGNFWTATAKASASSMWHIILNGRTLIKKACSWNIINGRSISIWTDFWFYNQSFPIPTPTFLPLHLGSVADLIDQTSNSWNEDLILATFDPSTAESILKTKIHNPTSVGDPIEDSLSLSGLFTPCFSSKAIYQLLWLQNQPQTSSFNSLNRLTKLVMKQKGIPPRVKTFIWRALNGGLATRDVLHKLGILTVTICPLCNKEDETLDHLLISCDYTRSVWQKVNCALPCSSSLSTWLEMWLKPPFNSPKHNLSAFAFAAILSWFIWKSRCDSIFGGSIKPPSSTLILAEVYASIHSSNYSCIDFLFNIASQHRWLPPPPHVIKINIDAASRKDGSAVGVIARNHHGRHLISHGNFGPSSSALDCEAHALLIGLRLALSMGWNDIILESDCLVLVHMIHGAIAYPPHMSHILGLCWSLLKDFRSSNVLHVRRTSNICAHDLANYAYRHRCTLFSDSIEGPDFICNQIISDVI